MRESHLQERRPARTRKRKSFDDTLFSTLGKRKLPTPQVAPNPLGPAAVWRKLLRGPARRATGFTTSVRFSRSQATRGDLGGVCSRVLLQVTSATLHSSRLPLRFSRSPAEARRNVLQSQAVVLHGCYGDSPWLSKRGETFFRAKPSSFTAAIASLCLVSCASCDIASRKQGLTKTSLSGQRFHSHFLRSPARPPV